MDYDADPFHHLVARHLINGLPKNQGTVLDIATGTGIAALEAMRQLTPARLIALDIDETMLAQARKKDPQGTVEWLRADAVPAPFPDASVDLIICSSAAHLIGPHLFPDWGRLLKPTGTVAFTVPSDETFRPSADFVAKLPIPGTSDQAAALAEGFATRSAVEFHTTIPRKRAAFLVRASDFRP